MKGFIVLPIIVNAIISILALTFIRTFVSGQSLRLVALSILWGVLSFTLALIIHDTLLTTGFSRSSIQLYSAPVLEELLKALPLFFLYSRFHDRPQLALFVGFVIGLGFAVTESTLYILANPAASWATGLVRSISIHFIHGFGTALVAFVWVRTNANLPRFAAVSAAILIHAIFNALTVVLDGSFLVFVAANLGIASILLLAFLLQRYAVPSFLNFSAARRARLIELREHENRNAHRYNKVGDLLYMD